MPDYPIARDAFLSEMVRSPYTIRNYKRGINLFIGDLSDKDDGPRFPLPPLASLGGDDRAILVRYAQWLMEARRLTPTTTRLYLVAVRRWFKWMGVNDYLPPDFPLTKAQWAIEDALKSSTFRQNRRPPEPPEGIERVITHYDDLTFIVDPEKPEVAQREALTLFRNRALMHCLAETGGRVGEVLQLRVGDFPPQCFGRGEVWRVEVRGKGAHYYHLRFLDALPHVETYIQARDVEENTPLFVYHSKRYNGNPMQRRAAWEVVSKASKGQELEKMHPHDFRHYVASKLVNAGEPLDVVQDYLGHRSVETTRGYYAHTREARVDEATQLLRAGGPGADRADDTKGD